MSHQGQGPGHESCGSDLFLMMTGRLPLAVAHALSWCAMKAARADASSLARRRSIRAKSRSEMVGRLPKGVWGLGGQWGWGGAGGEGRRQMRGGRMGGGEIRGRGR